MKGPAGSQPATATYRLYLSGAKNWEHAGSFGCYTVLCCTSLYQSAAPDSSRETERETDANCLYLKEMNM